MAPKSNCAVVILKSDLLKQDENVVSRHTFISAMRFTSSVPFPCEIADGKQTVT